jgi:Sulfatase
LQKFLSEKGIFIFLIPAFFVLHGCLQNFGLIGVSDSLVLLIGYFIATIIIFLLVRFLFISQIKTSLLTGFLFSFYLFFGALDDFFKIHLYVLSKYIIIIPLFILSLFVLILYFKKTTNHFHKFTFYLNFLFIVLLTIDIAGILWKSCHPNSDKLSVYAGGKKYSYENCDVCESPDIYFLLFDAYSSSIALQKTFNYNNSELDSSLLKKGFSLQRFSHSNYNFTPFSMASILNMNYISGIKNAASCSIHDYNNCYDLIRNNEVIRFLSSRHYDIVNYSIFELAGNPTLIESSLLPAKTRLITEQTLFNRMVHDIGWNLLSGKFEIKWLSKNLLYGNLNNNNKILTLLEKESREKVKDPRFIYAHFEMPHPPFYYDKDFQLRDIKELVDEQISEPISSYKGYLPYTNKKINELVDTIQKNTNNSAVIIIMGDHGCRVEVGNQTHDHYFQNLNAIYFPDKDYHLLEDGLTGVNQFRSVFNTLFKQHLPLLKDSTIFLTDQR